MQSSVPPADGDDPDSGGASDASAATASHSFGSQLRKLRLQAGLSQEVLAERAGLSATTIAAYERNRRLRPYPTTLAALAAALGLPPDSQAAFIADVSAMAVRKAEPDLLAESDLSPPTPTRLPRPPTVLFGRETDVASAVARLEPHGSSVRMLTLIGPGGVGKTRLALAVADALGQAFADGVVFVDLCSVRDHRLVPALVARTLNIHESPGRSARELLLDYLRDRQMLIVLDNLEQVLGTAPMLAELLASCERISLLGTSRGPLRIRAEQRFAVGPLEVPPHGASKLAIAESAAVQMFVDRARAATADFSLEDANASAVAAICRRLDGIPLAIELAAVRVGLLGAQTLLRRLEHSLPVLGDGPSDVPERQQTLRQTLDWSHQLLAPLDQVLLRRLAVFSGGWTLEAAEAVCGGGPLRTPDILTGLAMLVDSSMVLQSSGRRQEPRFRMLEPIRDYALERLADSGETRDLLRQYARWAMDTVGPVTLEPPDPKRIRHLAEEADNLGSALRSAIDLGMIEGGLWLAVAMSTLWFVRGTYAEARGWLNELLSLPGADAFPNAHAHALTAAGLFACFQGDYVASDSLLSTAGVLAADLDQQLLGGVVQHFQANVCRWRGDLDGARALFESALATYRAVGHAMWTATVLAHLGFVLYEQDAVDRAAGCAEESRALFEAAGNTWGVSRALRVLGLVAARRQEAATAQALHSSSLAMDLELRDEHDSVHSMLALADDARRASDATLAWRLYRQSVVQAERAGNRLVCARGLEGLATLAAMQSPEQAVCWAAAAASLRAGLGARQPANRDSLESAMQTALEKLGAAAFAAAWNRGVQRRPAELLADIPA